MAVHLNRRSFLRHSGAAVLLRSVVGPSSLAQQASDGSRAVGHVPQEVLQDPVLRAAREFADLMLLHGRDRYGPKSTPLFVGQLNVNTRRIPTGNGDDPGLLKGNAATAGTACFCQNLMFDLGLLDTLEALTRLTGDQRYETARRDYLEYFLGHCRHPRSGYLPWGEHVGFDVIHDCPYYTPSYGNYHEVKAACVPWDGLWEANPQAIRHEIEVAFRRHICDEATFAFNRHASMEGTPNTGTPRPAWPTAAACIWLPGHGSTGRRATASSSSGPRR